MKKLLRTYAWAHIGMHTCNTRCALTATFIRENEIVLCALEIVANKRICGCLHIIFSTMQRDPQYHTVPPGRAYNTPQFIQFFFLHVRCSHFIFYFLAVVECENVAEKKLYSWLSFTLDFYMCPCTPFHKLYLVYIKAGEK